METEDWRALYVGVFVGRLCRESVSAGNVNPRAQREHGHWRRSLDLKGGEKWSWYQSWGLGCFPVQCLPVLGDSSSGHTLPTALFAQGDSILP